MPPATPQTWTTRSLIQWIASALQARDVESPRLCAEMLVSHVLGCDRLRLYMDADRPATPLERQTLRALVSRAMDHEPVQYLVGEAWFFSLPFKVDRRALIPRPCTEQIVETVVQHQRVTPGFESPVIADIGTGSGCIAVALARNIKTARVAATDVSSGALELAAENAARHRVSDRIEFLRGDLLAPLLEHPIGARLHYLVSNPPYIPDDQWNTPGMVGPNVKDKEPESALRGGPDGLAFVRPLIAQGPDRLHPCGLLLIEIASSTADEVLALVNAHTLLQGARIMSDLEGHPRTLVAQRT